MPTAIPLWLPRLLFAVFLVWTGSMNFLPEAGDYFATQFAVIGVTIGPWFSWAVGALQLLVAAALFMPGVAASRWLLLVYAGMALVPLGMLFTHPVWIEAEGGFPVIGAGQGLIKYLGIAGVSLYFALGSTHADGIRQESLRQYALWTMLAGLLLVMIWIGGMKFTEVEALGIRRLLVGSPFMGWMLEVFGVRGASNVIGVVELLGAAGLLFWRRHQGLFLFGALINIGTFSMTQTFLVTLPAWHPELGFPAVGSSGLFILKDLGLLAATLLLIRHSRPASAIQASAE